MIKSRQDCFLEQFRRLYAIIETTNIKTNMKKISLSILILSAFFGILQLSKAQARAPFTDLQGKVLGSSVHAPGANVLGPNGTVYYIDSNQYLRPYSSAGAFLSYGNSFSSIVPATDGDLALPQGAIMPPRDGSVINDKGTVYLITNGGRSGFASSQVFTALGYKWSQVINADTSFLPTLPPITDSSAAHQTGALVNDNGTIYIIGPDNTKIGVPSPSILFSWGYTFKDIVPANSSDHALPQGSVLPQATPGVILPYTNLSQGPVSSEPNIPLNPNTPNTGNPSGSTPDTNSNPTPTPNSTPNPTLTPQPPTISSFSASPSTINSGSSSTLSWSTTNSTNITISPGSFTSGQASGSISVTPSVTTIYTLTAANSLGSVSLQLTVTVNSTDQTNISPTSNSNTAPSGTVTVDFDHPTPGIPRNAYLNGVFGGINWGSKHWRWDSFYAYDTTGNIYFDSASGTSRTFTFVTPSILNSLTAYSFPSTGTLTLTDDNGQTKTQTNIGPSTRLVKVVTGWTKPSTAITVNFTTGWDLGLDDLNYTVSGGTPPPNPNPPPPPSPAPTISAFIATPATINSGSSSTLSWNTSGATSINITPGSITSAQAVGSATVTPTQTVTYTLTATNSAGSTTATTVVTVNSPNPPPTPAPTISSFTANPTSINQGSSSTLSWSTSNATNITINPGNMTSSQASSSVSVTPSATTTYTLTATNSTGSANASTTVTVNVSQPPPPPTPTAGAPVLFFSDLDSGPNSGGESVSGFAGAYVTLYGNFFGSSQGASTVTWNGQNCLRVLGPTGAYSGWGAQAQGTWYQEIKVQLGSGCNSGSGNFVVTVNGLSSNGLQFATRAIGTNHIYFTATTGSDSAAGSFAAPFKTIAHCSFAMKPGDICYIEGGVTQTTVDNFGAALDIESGGTSGMPVALGSYPGASPQPQIGSSSAQYGVRVPAINISENYWTFFGLSFDQSSGDRAFNINGIGPTNPSSFWRIIANKFQCPNFNAQAGCFTTNEAGNISFYGNEVTNVGVPSGSGKQSHSVYFSSDTNHVWVGWNNIHDNTTCRALQFHSSPLGGGGASDPTGHDQYDLHVFSNIIHGDNCDGINFATVDPSKGTVEAYNNLIYHVGLQVPPDGGAAYNCIENPAIVNTGSAGSGTIQIYNNTLYDCRSSLGLLSGVTNGPAGAFTNVNPPAMSLTNNIIFQLGQEPYISGNSSGISGNNNLWFNSSGAVQPGQTSGNLSSTNPLFNSPGSTSSADFHLQSGSSAIGRALTSIVPVYDIEGQVRSLSTPTLGAYESH